jgi:hypothetical protein
MKSIATRLAIAVLLSVALGAAHADITYTGSLTYPADPPQLYEWGSDWAQGVSISWVVSQNANLSWNYQYTLVVSGKNISHFIIEVSPDFTAEDLLNFSGPGEWSVGYFTPQPANPLMPEAVQGIKFTPGKMLSATVSFDSWRVPVWGDFYGRCGGQVGDLNQAYNLGFTSPDSDPLDAPRDGSVYNHLLVPDSQVADVPEPGTAALLMVLGMAGLGGAIRRRRRQR